MRIIDWSSDVFSSDLAQGCGNWCILFPPPDTAVCERSWMTRESYLIGYARVSKGDDQSNATQRRALDALGCKRVFEETASGGRRSEEHTSELQSLMRISYAVFCLKKTNHNKNTYQEE